ncbi:MAG: hypothetical protein IJR55_00950, partial [Clostridia bacterium]|nr:hypothetical protein [Clostridia bacterium]
MTSEKTHIYPLLAVFSSLVILVFGLIEAKNEKVFIFVGGAYVLLALIGCYRACMRVLPVALMLAAVFGGISFLARGEASVANAMGARILVICT